MKLNVAVCALFSALLAGSAASAHEGHDAAFGSRDTVTSASKRILIDEQGRRAIGLQTQALQGTSLTQSLRATGTVRAADNRVVEIYPSVSGVVRSVLVKEGDSVRRGQTLATIESSEIAATVSELLQERNRVQAQLQRSQAEYKTQLGLAERELEHSENDLKREEQLLKEGITARKTYVDALHEHEKDSFSVASLKKRLSDEIAIQAKTLKTTTESVKSQLRVMGLTEPLIEQAINGNRVVSSINVHSPISGTLMDREISIGATANRDRKVFTVVSLTPIWAEVEVFQEDIPKVHVGQAVSLTTASGKVLSGKVSLIGTDIDPASKTLHVRVVAENRSGDLKPGMFITAELVTGSVQNRLLLPSAAVVEKDGQKLAYVKSGKYFEPVPVKTGIAGSDDRVEVTDGLFEGDEVVVRGAKQLYAQSLLGSSAEVNHEAAQGAHEDHRQATANNERNLSPLLLLLALIVCTFAGVGIGMFVQRLRMKTKSKVITERDRIC